MSRVELLGSYRNKLVELARQGGVEGGLVQ